MTSASTTPLWLAGPSERRLRDISNVIASKAPYSPDYALSIAEDAAALVRLSTDFLRYANAYSSPLLRLSPELLHEIAAYVAALEPARPTTLGWIRLGHVSSAWRLALLSMRSLWASAVCDMGPCARPEILARTNGIPLSINLNDGEEDVEPIRISFAMENLAAARWVEIAEHDPNVALWTHEPRAISRRVFPLLEKLVITAMHRPDRDAEWLGTGVYELEPLSAPRLTSLSLANIFVPFSPENLTKLLLSRDQHYEDGSIPNDDALLPSPELFLDLLRRCVAVKTLLLQHFIPNLAPLPSTLRCAAAIHLPSIEKLFLNSPMPRITAIWSHLAPPPDSTIYFQPDYTNFHLTSGGFVNRERLPFLSLPLEHAQQSKRSQITALVVEVDVKQSLTQCGFFKRELDFATDSWEGLPVYAQTVERNAYSHFCDTWFCRCVWDDTTSVGDFIDAIPEALIAKVDTLDVTELSDQDLRRLLLRLPLLHTLIIHRPVLSSLAVLMTPSNPPNLSKPDYPIPNLRHLRLADLDLCAERNQSSICFQEVLDIVFFRNNAGLPLLRTSTTEREGLKDTDRPALHSFVARLKEMVPGVGVVIK